MSALPKQMSLDEFVAWEERQELKYEFDGVDVQAMTEETLRHSRVQVNLLESVGPMLRGQPFFVMGGNVKVRTATGIRYPDAMVVCAQVDRRANSISEPTILFEILSPSAGGRDLGAKNVEYQTLTSLRRYIVLHQAAAAAHVFFRDGEGEWAHEFVVSDGVLAMPEIGVDLPLSACYEGIDVIRRL